MAVHTELGSADTADRLGRGRVSRSLRVEKRSNFVARLDNTQP